MDYRQEIILLAEEFGRLTRRSVARVSTMVAQQGSFIQRIRDGGGITVDKYLAVKEWFALNWPADTAWPEGVTPPGTVSGDAAASVGKSDAGAGVWVLDVSQAPPDLVHAFSSFGLACLALSPEEAPPYHAMLSSMRRGDMLCLAAKAKGFVTVLYIGRVLMPQPRFISSKLGWGIDIDYLPRPFMLTLPNARDHYQHVRSGLLYQEFHPDLVGAIKAAADGAEAGDPGAAAAGGTSGTRPPTPTERRVLDLMRRGVTVAGDLAEELDVSRQRISQLLQRMARAGLVRGTPHPGDRKKRRMIYQLPPEATDSP